MKKKEQYIVLTAALLVVATVVTALFVRRKTVPSMEDVEEKSENI